MSRVSSGNNSIRNPETTAFAINQEALEAQYRVKVKHYSSSLTLDTELSLLWIFTLKEKMAQNQFLLIIVVNVYISESLAVN